MNGKEKEVGEDFNFKAEIAEVDSIFFSDQNEAQEL